jgi:hypothetical protein
MSVFAVMMLEATVAVIQQLYAFVNLKKCWIEVLHFKAFASLHL